MRMAALPYPESPCCRMQTSAEVAELVEYPLGAIQELTLAHAEAGSSLSPSGDCSAPPWLAPCSGRTCAMPVSGVSKETLQAKLEETMAQLAELAGLEERLSSEQHGGWGPWHTYLPYMRTERRDVAHTCLCMQRAAPCPRMPCVCREQHDVAHTCLCMQRAAPCPRMPYVCSEQQCAHACLAYAGSSTVP